MMRIRKEQMERNMMRDLLDRAFGGSVPRMISTLFSGRDITEEEMSEVKRIIEEREREDR